MSGVRARLVALGGLAALAALVVALRARDAAPTRPTASRPDAAAVDFAATVLEAPAVLVHGVAVEASPLDRAVEASVRSTGLEQGALVATDARGIALAVPFPFERVPPTASRVRALVRLRGLVPHPGQTRGVAVIGPPACVGKALGDTKAGAPASTARDAAVACGARAVDVTLVPDEPSAASGDADGAEALLASGDPARALAALDRARGGLAGEAAARADAVAADAAFSLGRNALARELADRGLASSAALPAPLRARLLRASILAQAESEEASRAPTGRDALAAIEGDDRERALDAALDLRVALAHDRFHAPPDVPAASRRLLDASERIDEAGRAPMAAMLCRAGRSLAQEDRAAGERAMKEAALVADHAGSVADRAFCAFAAGDYARDAGRLDEAEEGYARALRILGDHPLPREQREAWFSAALLSARRGRYAEALARAESAYGWVDVSLAMETDLAAREALLVDTGSYYGWAERFAIHAGDTRAAIEAAEWGKGRAFGALLRDRGDAPSSGAFVVTTGDLAAARAERLDVLARSLQDGDAAVSYTILGRNDAGHFELAIGVVTRARTTARLVELPDDAGKDMRALAAAVEAGDADRARALGARLYALLLAPIEPDLAGVRRLFVSPHLSLHALPWGALFDGARFAVERFSFARVPPLLLSTREAGDDAPLLAPASPRAWMVAVDPAHPSAAPLPGLRPLAADVTARVRPTVSLEGAQLTPERFLEGAAHVDAVFYGGHARYDATTPLASALLVTPSAAGVDRVEARAVLGLDHRLDLVFLLGCETSRLWEGRSSYGDEAMGLQRAFLVGGARHVLGALWPVLDRDAEDFVHALLAQDGGLDVVTAVGAAQRCLASARCPGRGVATWASFVVDAR